MRVLNFAHSKFLFCLSHCFCFLWERVVLFFFVSLYFLLLRFSTALITRVCLGGGEKTLLCFPGQFRFEGRGCSEGEQTLVSHSCSPTPCFPYFRYHLLPRDHQVLLSQEKRLWVGDGGKMLGLLPVSLPAFILLPILAGTGIALMLPLQFYLS